MTRGVKASRWVLFLCLALGGAAFDLASKSVIFAEVGEPGSPAVAVVPDILELRTNYNPGALWGFGRTLPHSGLIFAGLSVVAGLAIVAWLFVGGAASSLPLTVALGLIMAGAIGNCYDRLVFGQVRDFVHFHIDSINFDWAIFNFADTMLVAGAIILALFAVRPEPAEVEPEPEVESAEEAKAVAQDPSPSSV